jgi:hypothetical protein
MVLCRSQKNIQNIWVYCSFLFFYFVQFRSFVPHLSSHVGMVNKKQDWDLLCIPPWTPLACFVQLSILELHAENWVGGLCSFALRCESLIAGRMLSLTDCSDLQTLRVSSRGKMDGSFGYLKWYSVDHKKTSRINEYTAASYFLRRTFHVVRPKSLNSCRKGKKTQDRDLLHILS